jgi:hypothetical protein
VSSHARYCHFSHKGDVIDAKLIAAIVILFIFAVFIVQNLQVVDVSFLFWKIKVSRAMVLMVTFVLGLSTRWFATQFFWGKKGEKMKIMVGYDGSNASKEALRSARLHAKAFKA